jgi:ankyrin repeat protein
MSRISQALLIILAFLLAACGHWGAAAQSPLHSAVLADDLPKVKTLLPKAPPGSADTELFYARSAPMAEFLISAGASVKARAHGNCTPLHFAAAIHADDVVQALLRHGADVNAVDDGKDTPLMLAVGPGGGDPDGGFENQGVDLSEAKRLAVTQTLLKAGAKVDLRDSGGATALHHATSAGDSSSAVVKALVAAGADVNARSTQGDTPLHNAAHSEDLETIRFLVQQGADVNVKEWQGKRPVDLIQGNGPEADEMRRLLSK